MNRSLDRWSDEENMTLIFLAAMNLTDDEGQSVRGEINAVFGNDRSREAIVKQRLTNRHAILTLRDLIVSNPITVAKLWCANGIGAAHIEEELQNGTGAVAFDGNNFKEVTPTIYAGESADPPADAPVPAHRSCPNDLVRLAIERAVRSYQGGTLGDCIFNAAHFSCALMDIAGLKGGLDGFLVRAILTGRPDVELLSGGAHYRLVETLP